MLSREEVLRAAAQVDAPAMLGDLILAHGVCQREQVVATLEEMARMVDEQNAGDAAYHAMAENWDASPAFQAAATLIFEAFKQPNGYTEPLLHAGRRKLKAAKA